jgi:hypothetical protein
MDEMKLHNLQGAMLDLLGYIHKSSTEKKPDYANVVMNIHHDLLQLVSEEKDVVPRTKGYMINLPTVPARFSECVRSQPFPMAEQKDAVIKLLMAAVDAAMSASNSEELQTLLKNAMVTGTKELRYER